MQKYTISVPKQYLVIKICVLPSGLIISTKGEGPISEGEMKLSEIFDQLIVNRPDQCRDVELFHLHKCLYHLLSFFRIAHQ